MREPNWNIIFSVQTLLIIFIGSVLSYKMGLFEDIKQQAIHEVVAEESTNPLPTNTTTEPVKKEEIKEKTEDSKVKNNKVENINIVEQKKEDTTKEFVKQATIVENIKQTTTEDLKVFIKNTDDEVKKIMEKYKNQIKDSFTSTVTSYNSEAGQTDDSPCITASNVDVCKRNVEDIVATNDLPFHTKILIPEYFGDRIFYVEDRMNARYTGTYRLDVWMKKKVDSKNFGAKVLKIIVLK